MGREISIEDVLTGLDDLGIVLDSEGKTVLHVPAFYLHYLAHGLSFRRLSIGHTTEPKAKDLPTTISRLFLN